MSPENQVFWARVVATAGVVLAVFSHSQVIPAPYAQLMGELSAAIGAGAALWTVNKPGSVTVKELPADMQARISSRPPKG